MARDIRNGLGVILAILLVFVAAGNSVLLPIVPAVPNGSISPNHIPIITFVQTLPLLSAALLVLSLLASAIGYLLLHRDRATVIGVILAFAPFITLVVVGFLAIYHFPVPPFPNH